MPRTSQTTKTSANPISVIEEHRMELLTNQVLAGIATGAIYACMALAVVMIYQAIDHLNFAQGEMAMFSTFIAWQLIELGMPYWVAFLATLVISFVAGVLIDRVLFRPIHDAPILSHLVVFIALFGILNSLAGFIWDFNVKNFPTPFGSRPLLGTGLISSHDAGMIGVTILLLVFLYVFFRHTRIGLAMRAAAANPQSARLSGIRVGWMIALGWGMAAAIGAVAGMLIAPVVFLEPNMMTSVLLYGFAAAVVGGLTSPGGAVIGGFAVGIIENLAGTFIPYVGREAGSCTDPGTPRTAPAVHQSGRWLAFAGDRGRPGPDRAAAVRGQELPHLPADDGADLRHRHSRPEPAHRLQRAVLARAQRILRHRRLYGGDPDGPGGRSLLLDPAGC